MMMVLFVNGSPWRHHLSRRHENRHDNDDSSAFSKGEVEKEEADEAAAVPYLVHELGHQVKRRDGVALAPMHRRENVGGRCSQFLHILFVWPIDNENASFTPPFLKGDPTGYVVFTFACLLLVQE
jgi:hypothetical protein